MIGPETEHNGVDIEWMSERIMRIGTKFINEGDKTPYSGIHHAHLVWGAKEVMFKINERGELDYRKQLTVDFWDAAGSGCMVRNGIKSEVRLRHEIIGEYMLVYGYDANG
jgi:hypothetical protein